MAGQQDLRDMKGNSAHNNMEMSAPLLDSPSQGTVKSPSHNTHLQTLISKSTEHNSQTIQSPDFDSTEESNSLASNSNEQTISCGGIKISYELTPCSSTLTALYPTCRICQSSNEKGNKLITPCRCKGSLKYVHGSCLRKWVEMRCRYRKYEFPERCELCGYQYRKRKFIKCTKWKLPRMDAKDKIYHTVFLASLCIMIVCLVLSIYCILFDTNSGTSGKYKSTDGEKFKFTVGELVTLSSGIVFFFAFILAMTVEIKSRHTIFEVIKRMLRSNMVWVIENYDKGTDTDYPSMKKKPSK